ncbi:MAG TPA: response regulator [Gaiellaceae bacterium]|nr:response regulator [Gaiellaceae bacterium]
MSGTILVVEDMDVVRVMISTALKSHGYEVLSAGSPDEAFRIASENEIDLLMTDLAMPGGIGGTELAERLTEQRPNLRVLFTSGYTADDETKRAVAKTRGAFLQKPFVLEQLAETVRALLDGSSSSS